MKKNMYLFMILGVLGIIGIGISFAYFISGVVIRGDGASGTVTPSKLFKVVYDAGTSTLTSSNLMPGNTISKTFKVTFTPGDATNTIKYAIRLDVSANTFVVCDDTNYDSMSNACTKDAAELIYTLKDSSGAVIGTGDLTGKTGEVVLATETKTASSATDYNYTLEVTFNDTNADQNHNMSKNITGNVKVVFAD